MLLINWNALSRNPNAINLLEQNQDKINWNALSLNPNAIHLLKKNLDKINWCELSENPNAIFYFRKTKIKTPYKFFINEKFIIYWNKIKIKLIGMLYQKIQMH